MNRRAQWRKVLEREVARWSAMPVPQILEEAGDVAAYEVELDSQTYQVEVQIIEDTEEYLHVTVGVDDGSLPASMLPATQTFLCRKH